MTTTNPTRPDALAQFDAHVQRCVHDAGDAAILVTLWPELRARLVAAEAVCAAWWFAVREG